MSLKIEQDKKKHFFVGIPLGMLLQFLSMYLLPGDLVWTLTASGSALTAICYGFELYSIVSGKGHADNLDAIAGILGGIIGIFLWWCIALYL